MPLPTGEVDMLLLSESIGTPIPEDEITRKNKSNHVVGICLFERLPRASIDPDEKLVWTASTNKRFVCSLEIGFGFLSGESKRGRKRNGRGGEGQLSRYRGGTRQVGI